MRIINPSSGFNLSNLELSDPKYSHPFSPSPPSQGLPALQRAVRPRCSHIWEWPRGRTGGPAGPPLPWLPLPVGLRSPWLLPGPHRGRGAEVTGCGQEVFTWCHHGGEWGWMTKEGRTHLKCLSPKSHHTHTHTHSSLLSSEAVVSSPPLAPPVVFLPDEL